MVEHFIGNAQWIFPQSQSVEVQTVISKLQLVEFNVSEQDIVVWKPSSTGEYPMKDSYKSLDGVRNSINWHCLVWLKSHVPRHNLLLG